MKLTCKSDTYIKFKNSDSVYISELTVGSTYDMSISKIGSLSKNPFYSVLCDDGNIHQFSKLVIKQLFLSLTETREKIINDILK
jgi:hypothetical protein